MTGDANALLTTITPDQALANVHADATGVYRDLSGFRIEIALNDDGWHIDYELRDAKMTGGGPHYIVDADTGAIISKRYEQ